MQPSQPRHRITPGVPGAEACPGGCCTKSAHRTGRTPASLPGVASRLPAPGRAPGQVLPSHLIYPAGAAQQAHAPWAYAQAYDPRPMTLGLRLGTTAGHASRSPVSTTGYARRS